MKKIFVLLALITFLVPSFCFAYQYTPRSSGIIIDDKKVILGVNINGPAFNAGIRPGDEIIAFSDDSGIHTDIETIDIILRNSKTPFTVSYLHNYEQKTVHLCNEKITDLAVRSTFLIKGNVNENYSKLINAITYSPALSSLLPIKSQDENLHNVVTYSEINRHTVKNMKEYVIAMTGLGLMELQIHGSLSMTDANQGRYTVLKENLDFNGQWATLFGSARANMASSGVLEQMVIKQMYKPLEY